MEKTIHVMFSNSPDQFTVQEVQNVQEVKNMQNMQNMQDTKETTYIMFSDYPDMLTVSEVQKALRVGKNATYTLIKTGRLKSIRIGNSIRVRKPDLIDFVLQASIENTTSIESTRLE